MSSMMMVILGALASVTMVDILFDPAVHLLNVEMLADGLEHTLDSKMHKSIMKPLENFINDGNHWHNNRP
jgi:hypothetical protein